MLPDTRSEEMQKLLVLDIDQTLVHACDRPSSKRVHDFVIQLRGGQPPFYVFKRRGLDEFLSHAVRLKELHGLKLAIWTAAERTYAVKILDNIWPGWQRHLLFLRHRSHCTMLPDGMFVKELGRIPGEHDVLLVDDNPDTYALNTRMGFSVWKSAPYSAGSMDTELNDVLRFLHQYVKHDRPFPPRPKLLVSRQKMRSTSARSLKPVPKRG